MDNIYTRAHSYEMRRKIIFAKTLNKTQEELKTESRKKQSTENELKMNLRVPKWNTTGSK